MAPKEPPDTDHGRAEHEHKALIATILTHRLSRWMVIFGALSVAATVAGIVLAGCGPSDPAPGGVNVPGNSNTVNAPSGNCANVSGGNCVVELSPTLSHELTDASTAAGSDDGKFRQQLSQLPDADKQPAGPGPWPFVVVDTGDLGLFARTSDTVNATRVGNAGNRSIVWVDCIAQSDFTPPDVSGVNDVGPQWVQVRWKHLPSGTDRGLSEPTEAQTAWMYRGALLPLGSNGDIRKC